MEEDKSKKSPAESFAEMMREFGSSIAEIFNDPDLKEKAKDFGESAAASAKSFAARFKDDEVKNKFKDFGNAAKVFGESVVSYFREDKKESPKDSGGAGNAGTSQNSGKNSDGKDSESEGGSSTEGDPAAVKSLQKQETAGRNARIAGYGFAIAWNIIFFIFFNFFNKYIAYYSFNEMTDSWSIIPLITDSFNLWLPVLNASLIASVIGNIILIANDSFYFDNITNIFMDFFGIAAVASLLLLFPVDLSILPPSNFNLTVLPVLIKTVLVLIIVGLSVGIIVRFVKVIVKAVKSN